MRVEAIHRLGILHLFLFLLPFSSRHPPISFCSLVLVEKLMHAHKRLRPGPHGARLGDGVHRFVSCRSDLGGDVCRCCSRGGPGASYCCCCCSCWSRSRRVRPRHVRNRERLPDRGDRREGTRSSLEEGANRGKNGEKCRQQLAQLIFATSKNSSPSSVLKSALVWTRIPRSRPSSRRVRDSVEALAFPLCELRQQQQQRRRQRIRRRRRRCSCSDCSSLAAALPLLLFRR